MMKNKRVYSFEDIASELSQPLLRYLTKMTGNAVDAEDLLQQTLLRIATNLSQFKGDASVKTWAFKIATNIAIDFFRKNKKNKYVEFPKTDKYSYDDSNKIIIKEMNDCIRKVIDTLPPNYRSALILTNFEGKSIEETATICDISISLAKVRVHRAKKHLQEALEKKCEFYSDKDGSFRCTEKKQK